MRFLIIVTMLGLTGCVTAEERLAQDDNYCRSIGLKFGTQDYAACRIMRTNVQHVADENRRDRLLLTGLTLMNQR